MSKLLPSHRNNNHGLNSRASLEQNEELTENVKKIIIHFKCCVY